MIKIHKGRTKFIEGSSDIATVFNYPIEIKRLSITFLLIGYSLKLEWKSDQRIMIAFNGSVFEKKQGVIGFVQYMI